MKQTIIYILLAVAAGVCIPTQAGINAQLSHLTRSAVLAATVSFAVGTLCLTFYSVATRLPPPAAATIAAAPWWVWCGGALGAFFVTSTIFLVPKLGATTMLSLVLAGQMATSLLLDHYGAFGFPQHAISVPRVLGVLLVVAGALLVRKF